MTANPPTILFVCVHNAGRSQMAAAFLNRKAGARLIGLSAGTAPGDHVHPEVIEAMREVGIDLVDSAPQLLTPEMAADAARVVSMGCGVAEACPALRVPMEDWDLDDPKGQPVERVRHIRDEISRRVDVLLRETTALGQDSGTRRQRQRPVPREGGTLA